MQPDVSITDVVLRDGLQDEPRTTSIEDRTEIAKALISAGIRDIEAASFVDPRRVPQMAGAEALAGRLLPMAGTRWRALALNGKGIARAAAVGFTDITLVVSASSAHSRVNAGRTPAEVIADFAPAVEAHPNVRFSGGISTAFVCPFEGIIASRTVVELVDAYADLGIERIGLADTIGTAEPSDVESTVVELSRSIPVSDISLHLHNAHGRAFDTVDRAIAVGVRQFDAATGGYGGCPFAPGAHGNIATEDLVSHLHSRGLTTAIDPAGLNDAKHLIVAALTRGTPVLA